MNEEILSSIEIDAIGEVINISLGSSATAVSNMLNARVDITVPRVRVESYDEFQFKNLEPAIAVAIDYVVGITGNNIMILKRGDIRVILEMLMQTEIDDATFELDEISLSAVCEVMNQMMGASSTALSELMGKMINISPPETFEIKDAPTFKEEHFSKSDNFVVIEFDLSIEGRLKSEFMNVMPVKLAKEMVASFMREMNMDSDAMAASEPVREIAQEVPAEIVEEVEPDPGESRAGMLTQEQIEAMLRGDRSEEAKSTPRIEQPTRSIPEEEKSAPEPVVYSDEPRVIEVRESQKTAQNLAGVPKQENLEMLMDVPLVVSVEIGRTKKPIREILEITQGSLIVLDKLAGEQVEVYANNRCIARGDVVVVHDNFGIRVTEVIGKG